MTILVTGANRGIGRALYDQYRTANRQVIGTARTDPGFLALDVTRPADFATLTQKVIGPLSLLICNAGVYPDGDESLETGYAPELWAATFAANVTGVFLTVQALLPQLRAARGKVAIISSSMGSDARAPGGSYIYRASKAAVLNLGRNLATDLRADGIAVGIYHPGWVQTDMGGAGADVTPVASAQGLAQRFDALDLARSGCFEDHLGRAIPF